MNGYLAQDWNSVPVDSADRLSADENIGHFIDEKFADIASFSRMPRSRILHQITNPRLQLTPSLEGSLFEAKKHFKLYIAQVAMHVSKKWRDGIYRQIDNLLDPEEWDLRDPCPTASSIDTMCRVLMYVGREKRPGLGISVAGNMITAWTHAEGRLTIECRPGNIVFWSLSRATDGQRERAAGETNVDRLKQILSPYNPNIWFINAI